LKPERKLWLDLKKNTPTICWNRIENLAVPGLPDLLGYNKQQRFFTVELKVTRSNKIRFSPHQIAFHVQHPKDTFILVKSLDTSLAKLYEGEKIRELVACGLQLDACASKLEACCLLLESLGA
jgi:nicotinamidase-related amidase